MKKLKIVIWLIIILFLGLIVYQNSAFFLAKESLGIDLFFTQYQSPELPVVLFFAGLFCLGWLVAYLFGLAERFRSAKQIKALQQNSNAQQHAIDDMKRDVASLKPGKGPEPQPLTAEDEGPATEETAAIEAKSESDPKAAPSQPGPPADQN